MRRNLCSSFPEKSKEEIIAIEKKFYAFFCDYLFETLKLLTISKAEMARRMKFEGIDALNESFGKGKCVGLYLGHYCNWEWISSIPLHLNPSVVGGQIYHKLRSAASDRLFLKLRERMGAVSIPMKSTLRRIAEFRRDRQQFVIGFISDQTPKWENIHFWTNFLNQDTPVFTGTEKIIRQVGMDVFYLDVVRPRRGYYTATYRKLADAPAELPEFKLTELYMRELEKTIRREPQYWLWTHNRWKRTREEFERMFEVTDEGRVRVRN